MKNLQVGFSGLNWRYGCENFMQVGFGGLKGGHGCGH